MVVTMLGFGAFAHAFFLIHAGEEDLANLFLKIFGILLTGSLPEDACTAQSDTASVESCLVSLYLTYFPVIMFTVFFLNIFIGVISEKYAIAQEQGPLRSQEVLADACMKFLLRAKRIPVIKGAQKNR